MGSRLPVEHYDLSSAAAANSYIGTSLHDPNSGDEAAADHVTDDNDDRSSAVASVSTKLVDLFLLVVVM